MTIQEAISRVDALKPNAYSEAEKIAWLSDLDTLIKREVIDTHEGGEEVEFEGYGLGTSLTTDLIVGSPYEEVYIAWLTAQIDFYNGETAKYNNSITRYSNLYTGFANDYNRSHMPIGSKFKYW